MTLPMVRVCSFESRRGDDMASLIRRHGGEPFVAPSMQEIPLDENRDAVRFGDRLLRGEVDVMVFLTGVGTIALLDLLNDRLGETAVKQALERCRIVVRGPKPVAALKPRQIRIDHRAAEPNTWREIVSLLEGNDLIRGKTVAVQEYGQPSTELYRELERLGASVVPVPIYRWALPDDVEPLRTAIAKTIAGEFDVLLFTSAQQVWNVLDAAEQDGRKEAWLAAAGDTLIGSIGPTCSEALREAGLTVGVEASPTKMGRLVAQTLSAARNEGGDSSE